MPARIEVLIALGAPRAGRRGIYFRYRTQVNRVRRGAPEHRYIPVHPSSEYPRLEIYLTLIKINALEFKS